MGFLSDAEQQEVMRLFGQLVGDVKIILFTQRESPLYIPGLDCETCRDTRLLLEEVAALSQKLHLEVHDFDEGSDLAREYGITRIPAFVMTSPGVKGKVRYFGLPSGYEFSVLIGSLIEVSQAEPSNLETSEASTGVEDFDRTVHLQVFVTPT